MFYLEESKSRRDGRRTICRGTIIGDYGFVPDKADLLNANKEYRQQRVIVYKRETKLTLPWKENKGIRDDPRSREQCILYDIGE